MSGAVLLAAPGAARGDAAEDARVLAALDERYQAAVERNDAAEMDKILADDFALVLGDGKSYTKSDLLESARTRHVIYERQVDSERTVRVWGDTAVVTALLWLKGTTEGRPIERRLWFSDTYVRTADGWRYVFGQASLPLPDGAR